MKNTALKNSLWIALLGVISLLWASIGKAQTTISNNLTVLGYLDLTNNIVLGTTVVSGTNNSAELLSYTDSNRTIGFISTRPLSA